ncbi:MAG: ThuA domain-containing protein [Phycisphaeraceae bacterium]
MIDLVPTRMLPVLLFTVTLAAISSFASPARGEDPLWVTYEGKEGPGSPGKGKHIVLIAGDDEYRSEEALPQLGKILATQHGFKCTVLFPIDPATGQIKPDLQTNIPGTEALKTADLMIMATRFRNLPDEQMKPIDDYLMSGKPVIGMRTATHGFNGIKGTYAKYNFNYNNKDEKEWTQGFGRLVLGETWISHHGGHKTQSTRGLIADTGKDHPITRGLKDGDVWGDTDVYGVRLPLPGDSKPIILGQVLVGMKPDDKPLEGKKNDPMMPVGWTKSYQLPEGKEGKAFCTTMGSSTDLVSQGTRRMLVNAVYFLLDIEVPKDGAKAEIVGEFKPTMYGFGSYKKGTTPKDYEMK